MSAKRDQVGQRGSALLELLIAGIVLGIAVVGISLMISLGQSMVVGHGDEYTALYFAQEMIEQCISKGFGQTCGNPSSPFTETLTAGQSGSQTFTRVTTVTHSATRDQVSVTVTPALQKGGPATLVTTLTCAQQFAC